MKISQNFVAFSEYTYERYLKVSLRTVGTNCKSKWKFQIFRDSFTVSWLNTNLDGFFVDPEFQSEKDEAHKVC